MKRGYQPGKPCCSVGAASFVAASEPEKTKHPSQDGSMVLVLCDKSCHKLTLRRKLAPLVLLQRWCSRARTFSGQGVHKGGKGAPQDRERGPGVRFLVTRGITHDTVSWSTTPSKADGNAFCDVHSLVLFHTRLACPYRRFAFTRGTPFVETDKNCVWGVARHLAQTDCCV